MKPHKKSYVTASEIGEFVYCKRGWWLRQHGQGIVTDAMNAGTKAHNALFLAILTHKKKMIFASIILAIGLVLLMLFFWGGVL